MALESSIEENRGYRYVDLAETLRDSIHVWHVSIHRLAPFEAKLRVLLSQEELARSRGFIFRNDRRRYVITRSVLRILLGRYTNQEPASISIRKTPTGKPFVADEGAPQFSVSYSDEHALLAFAYGRIGIDVERLREVPDLLGIAKHFFLPREAEQLRALPKEESKRVFFAYWTRKEACLKATGEGLSALNSFSDPVRSGALCHETADPRREGNAPWRIFDISVSTGFVAVVATNSVQQSWQLFEFNDEVPAVVTSGCFGYDTRAVRK